MAHQLYYLRKGDLSLIDIVKGGGVTSIILRSAGTLSPSPISTRSPGTSSLANRSCFTPSRILVERGREGEIERVRDTRIQQQFYVYSLYKASILIPSLQSRGIQQYNVANVSSSTIIQTTNLLQQSPNPPKYELFYIIIGPKSPKNYSTSLTSVQQVEPNYSEHPEISLTGTPAQNQLMSL